MLFSENMIYGIHIGEHGSVYLLNTDYDLPITAKITHNGKEQSITLDSLEMKRISI